MEKEGAGPVLPRGPEVPLLRGSLPLLGAAPLVTDKPQRLLKRSNGGMEVEPQEDHLSPSGSHRTQGMGRAPDILRAPGLLGSSQASILGRGRLQAGAGGPVWPCTMVAWDGNVGDVSDLCKHGALRECRANEFNADNGSVMHTERTIRSADTRDGSHSRGSLHHEEVCSVL